MTIFKHELKQNKKALSIWTIAISFMLGLCIIIYPEMSADMDDIGKMFSDMGGFSAAFGMDKINFGSFIGFFSVECGNVLGLGGAFFAALIGISALAKEEKEHTAEFLLTHPISRKKIVAEKLLAILAQLVILNLIVAAVTCLSIIIIDTEADTKKLSLILLSYFIMQIEVSAITFGISAFIRNNGLGLGLGLAAIFYFLNIVANLIEETKFLKYITPFGYTEGADIISDGTLNTNYLTTGILLTIASIMLAFYKYNKKDIS